MFKKFIKITLLILLVLLISNVFVIGSIQAQSSVRDTIEDQIEALGQIGLPGEPERPADVVVDLIRMLLGFLALVFLILILYAGFKWMSSAGNTEVIDKAKKMITSALIGLAIIFLSYAITAFIFNVVMHSRFDWR